MLKTLNILIDAILTFAPFYSRLVDNFEERAQVRILTAKFVSSRCKQFM